MGVLEKRILSGRYLLAEQESDSTELVEDSEIIIDITSAFQHSYSAEVTSHAVEQDADVTDNIKLQPFTITLSWILLRSLDCSKKVETYIPLREVLEMKL